MSAKIKLFKKVNESQAVNEGEVTQQPAAPVNNQQPQQQAQPAQNQQQQATQQQAANQQQAQTQQTQPVQNTQQQQTIDQQLQTILVKHFGVLQQNIAKDLANIQGVKWINVIQPKDQSFNSVMEALQSYVKQNIEAAKAAVQQNQKQQTQNTSTNQ